MRFNLGRYAAVAMISLVGLMLASCGAQVTVPSDFPAPPSTTPPEWTALEPMPLVTKPFSGPGNQYINDAVAYGDGFVAVGEDFQSDERVSGLIWLSPDGLSWKRLAVAENDLAGAQIDRVTTNGKTLVAVGVPRPGPTGAVANPILWVSDDGASWRRFGGPPPFEAALIRWIVGGPSGFVAWGTDGPRMAFFQSADGAAWQRVSTDPVFTSARGGSVRPYRGGFVATGFQPLGSLSPSSSDGKPSGSGAATWWSPDGQTWHAADTDAAGGPGIIYVGAGGLLGLAGPDCGHCVGRSLLWQSDDGRHWHRLGEDTQAPPEYASDGVRIVRFEFQDSGKVFTSTDGRNWRHIGAMPLEKMYGLIVGKHGILVREKYHGVGADVANGAVRFGAAH